MVGLLGRVAAFGIIGTMIVAAVMVHSPFGLFMNWSGNQQGEGIEYHLLAIAFGLAVTVKGSGALLFDYLISRLGSNPASQSTPTQATSLSAEYDGSTRRVKSYGFGWFRRLRDAAMVAFGTGGT